MCLDTAINMNEIVDVSGDGFDAYIDLGYQNNNEAEPAATIRNITGTVVDKQQFGPAEIVPPQNYEPVPVVHTLSDELSISIITDEDVVDYVPENPPPRKSGSRSHVCTHLRCCS